MSETYPIRHHLHLGIVWRNKHRKLLPAFLVLLLAVLGLAIATSLFDVVRGAPTGRDEVAATAVTFPARELPREWRWAPQSVETEHMYRDKQEPKPRKWIR